MSEADSQQRQLPAVTNMVVMLVLTVALILTMVQQVRWYLERGVRVRKRVT